MDSIEQGVQFVYQLVEPIGILFFLNLLAEPVHALAFLRSHHGAQLRCWNYKIDARANQEEPPTYANLQRLKLLYGIEHRTVAVLAVVSERRFHQLAPDLQRTDPD
jgi:hypothetical protein